MRWGLTVKTGDQRAEPGTVTIGARTENCEENQRIKFILKDWDQDGQPSCWTVHWATKGGENNSKEIIESPKRCLKVPGRPQPPSYQVGLKKKDQLHSQSLLEANVISTDGEETGRHFREGGNNQLERGKKGSILGQSRWQDNERLQMTSSGSLRTCKGTRQPSLLKLWRSYLEFQPPKVINQGE